jgi:hypothetical protein
LKGRLITYGEVVGNFGWSDLSMVKCDLSKFWLNDQKSNTFDWVDFIHFWLCRIWFCKPPFYKLFYKLITSVFYYVFSKGFVMFFKQFFFFNSFLIFLTGAPSGSSKKKIEPSCGDSTETWWEKSNSNIIKNNSLKIMKTPNFKSSNTLSTNKMIQLK